MLKSTVPTIKFSFLTVALSLSALSFNVQAALTSYNNEGVDLVYSSISDVTWTKDANLLGSWIANATGDTDANGNGINDIFDAIIAASPTITNTPNTLSPTGIYTVTASDFYNDGNTTWFGAMAFVSYLNSINYAGSSQWALPTVVHTTFGFQTLTNGSEKGDEFIELSQELNGVNGIITNPTDFDNVTTYSTYWSSTEVSAYPAGAYYYASSYGTVAAYAKNFLLTPWAVSPGQIAAVPEPESLTMLLAGLGLLSGLLSRRKQYS